MATELQAHQQETEIFSNIIIKKETKIKEHNNSNKSKGRKSTIIVIRAKEGRAQ